jgi:hypothetical protein
MKRNYLALYSENKSHLGQLGSYDTDKKRWVSNPCRLTMDEDLERDLEAFDFGKCYFLQSHHRDLSNAKFGRNRNGEILVSERPIYLSVSEGVAMALKAYRSSKAQLANLKPMALTPDNRYVKKVTIFTETLLEQAIAYHSAGMALRQIAQRLDVNHESLRRTLRKRVV